MGFGGPDYLPSQHPLNGKVAKNSVLWLPRDGDPSVLDPVDIYNPLPVLLTGSDGGLPSLALSGPIKTPRAYQTPFQVIPGVVAGAAYAIGDAVGTQFTLAVPVSGIIQDALLIDQDKEQSSMTLSLFSVPLTADSADNAALDIADGDLFNAFTPIQISSFVAYNDNALGYATGLGIPYRAPSGFLTIKAMTGGVPNLTAATDYAVALVILPDADL